MTHRLLPWLFRFPGGLESEQRLVERFLGCSSNDDSKTSKFEKIVEMHNRYVPTRLIDWTENIYIALFCALARELDAPTIFVLDPLKLNRLSGLKEIPSIESFRHLTRYFSDWPNEAALPQFPIAIRSGIVMGSDTVVRIFDKVVTETESGTRKSTQRGRIVCWFLRPDNNGSAESKHIETVIVPRVGELGVKMMFLEPTFWGPPLMAVSSSAVRELLLQRDWKTLSSNGWVEPVVAKTLEDWIEKSSAKTNPGGHSQDKKKSS